ncbi:MAG: MBOAT family protein [Planctomycetaceae bacterium]|nr:MBOAT family protein [Planctomycetaceae bacterium]
MLFNSYTFLVFFCGLLLLHLSLRSWLAQKVLLLISSYLFYAAWNPKYVFLLLLSTVVDWYAAKWIYETPSTMIRRLCLFVSLTVNLGLLATFKYGNFFIENLTTVFESAGLTPPFSRLDVLLPVGISFYTFQTLSYTIDVYRRIIKPADSMLDFALYVTFFPQLVAGPIVRAVDFLPQCAAPPNRSWRQFHWGLGLLLIGLFEKVVIADHFMAPIVERVYDTIEAPTFVAAWTGTLAFAMQIFCDFAGYSTSAIGVALCLGFSLPDNFRFPYAAIGFSDFWRRWHISLSSWLRDYLYIPLGGNRLGHGRTYINLFVTMLLGGLWHGASWTFVVWGGLHGLYLAAERLLRSHPLSSSQIWKSWTGRVSLAAVTFVLVNVAWVFFRAKSFRSAFTTISAMFGAVESRAEAIPSTDVFWTLLIVSTILITHWLMRNISVEELVDRLPPWILAVGVGLMIAGITMATGEDRAFIYFQF